MKSSELKAIKRLIIEECARRDSYITMSRSDPSYIPKVKEVSAAVAALRRAYKHVEFVQDPNSIYKEPKG